MKEENKENGQVAYAVERRDVLKAARISGSPEGAECAGEAGDMTELSVICGFATKTSRYGKDKWLGSQSEPRARL